MKCHYTSNNDDFTRESPELYTAQNIRGQDVVDVVEGGSPLSLLKLIGWIIFFSFNRIINLFWMVQSSSQFKPYNDLFLSKKLIFF